MNGLEKNLLMSRDSLKEDLKNGLFLNFKWALRKNLE